MSAALLSLSLSSPPRGTADAQVVAGMRSLREIFVDEKECLIHGDLHTGSVMVPDAAARVRRPAKVIDADLPVDGTLSSFGK